ncbi:MAG: inositol monophosphatase family protein [Caulobacteraceae bacterium]|nr:inositol monophosphatase family protein [Caulobacteraceae bacterium]
MSTPSALLKVMIDAVRKAARGLTRDFGELAELQVSRKGPADYVSAADLKAEQVLFEALSAARAGYGFLGEERGLIEGTDKTHTWIADPLDGTTNFLHAIPHFAVTVGLEREGQIVAGVTYNPITNELYWAEKGKGCFLNDKRLRVAARRELADTVLATGIPFMGRPGHATFLKELHQIAARVSGVRRFGSAALDLAYVAAGRFDGYWERGIQKWDIAAGMLFVTEAGGVVSDADGGDNPMQAGTICVANSDLHPQIIERLRG